MPVTGCTWRSSPNVLGCWDRGEPRRPVRVGHSHPTAGSLFPWSRSCLPLLGRFWRLCGARRSWLDVGAGGVGAPVAWDPRAPRKVQRPGASCACGDISARPGTGDAAGDGIAVPDGVECPRPEGHAPGHVECPRRRRWPAGCRCPEPEDAPEGSRSVPAGGHARGLRCVLDDVRARSSARTEWQEDGRVLPRRKPGAAVRTHGMPEDRRGASRRAGPAVHPGLTVIVTTRPHQKT